MFSVTIVYQGTPEAAEAVIRPLRSVPIADDGLKTMTYLEVQAMSGQLPFGLRHYWKGHFLRELDGGAIEATVAAMDLDRASESFILLEAFRSTPEGRPRRLVPSRGRADPCRGAI